MSVKKIGFIGLGIMGKPMALHLLSSKNLALYVNDIKSSLTDELSSRGAHTASLSEMGAECSVIFAMLPHGDIVQEVLFGENGITSSIKKGAIVCDMSSVAPGQSKFCAEKLKKMGIAFLDAPVSGGEPKAIDGTLSFMAGGDEPTFNQILPYFRMMGQNATLVGENGIGSITKLANQIIVNMNIAAMSEAFVFAAKAGADPDKVYHAIRGGLAGSAVLDAKIPMILDRNFTPGGPLYINHKDIKNVIAEAHADDIPIPFTSQLFEIMQSLKVGGHMNDDHGGIIQYFENLADYQVERL